MSFHVLHVIDALALGGAERMAVELANRTVRDGHRASLCVTRSDLTLAPKLDPRVELVVLGRKRRFETGPLRRLARWCRAQGVDVVHCHGRSSFSLVALLAALRLVRAPLVLHDHLGVQLHARVPRWFQVARRQLAAYVGIDETQRAWARRAGIAEQRAHTIVNAIDLGAVANATVTGIPLERRSGQAAIVCVGGLRPEKAIDVVLDAFALVRAPARLHVIGGDADPAYARHCRERAAALGDRVVFEGQREDALALARTADLAVHGARSESGPLVLAEYAALEIPFVATRVGGIAEQLAGADAGWFVPPDDAVALATAIDVALVSRARERVARARELAAARFDISAVAERWYALYREVQR